VTRLARPERRPAALVTAAVLAAAALVLSLRALPVRPRPLARRPIASALHRPPADAPGDVRPLPAPLGASARPLPAGTVDLGEARVRVAAGSRAEARMTGSGAELALLAGQVDLEVAPQGPGRHFAVVVGPYRFVVLGTVFTLERHGASVSLSVQEGRVAVERGARRLAVVTGGQSWTGPPARRTRARAPRADPVAEEIAAYAGSRARMQAGDLAGALEALRSCRRRFPRGALQAEVTLSIVELLSRLGRFPEALAESGAFLAAHPDSERAGELHRLRATIYRDVLADPARAAGEDALAREPR
jgi:hypothetical protein